MNDLSIRDIITKINDGNIRIPAFQRGFIWDAESVAFLMDSIYKGYPFGTIQLWRTREELKTEKNFGFFNLFKRDKEYPIDYVLDGQQRITSIFGVFQTESKIDESIDNPFNVYFDLNADIDAQETQFLALKTTDIDSARHFPLNSLFDTVKYRTLTRSFDDETALKIDGLQSIFKEIKIPFQTLETDEKSKVAIVFERINRKGVPLDTLQLLTAWTWSEDFDLQDKFTELQDEVRPYGFEELGNNANLLLRISSAILSNDASAKALIELNGSVVREQFDKIINGVKGAIDFLKTNLKIEKLDNLPYDSILIPLAVFFANEGNKHYNYDDKQRSQIIKWFWITSFSRRYSAGTLRALNRDIEEMNKLKDNTHSNIDDIHLNMSSDFFTTNIFNMGTVNTKSFILLLAQNHPKSFITGSMLTLSNTLKEYNRNEFHHLYPKAYLNTQDNLNYPINSLANFCFLSRADNKKLGGSKPSIYKSELPDNLDEIFESALCNQTKLFSDNYNNFIDDRKEYLFKYLKTLIA